MAMGAQHSEHNMPILSRSLPGALFPRRRRTALVVHMCVGPAHHGYHNGVKIAPLLGQNILVPLVRVSVSNPFNDTVPNKPLSRAASIGELIPSADLRSPKRENCMKLNVKICRLQRSPTTDSVRDSENTS